MRERYIYSSNSCCRGVHGGGTYKLEELRNTYIVVRVVRNHIYGCVSADRRGWVSMRTLFTDMELIYL